VGFSRGLVGGFVPPFSFSVFVFFSVVPRLSFNFFVPFSVYRSYFLLPFCRSNRTQIHPHQDARRRRRQRSRRMPARERRSLSALSRPPQWRQTRFFGDARLSRMRSRLHHHTLTPTAAHTHTAKDKRRCRSRRRCICIFYAAYTPRSDSDSFCKRDSSRT